ncbi:2,5-didehydrogluconate reductase [Thermoclostridium stercorarium subsp. stercorarium DSM 8532]|uniref:2,5-didehydrogluconate reductase n=3 Tax=Thermoclostridium stercorarium TaxID=1510 RepID=L7VHH8_THES1|nr:aldo/keto reductase [Thermoclostridium stercorarium]AGC67495.1 2,5-didehydrogluconate reductase [Thermoclostridium stercorarium subsp. stercorarium DSM 8532]AGI38550.1 aldo/keto reductase [Thermoclostridium stercorarium subsp. stercorarium DSM 8532]ANW97923.1 glyoxal reductase [Thermoclostridium stercorarium subsp. thermolacticum DSM 2910]ANX00473.1 glyoxal reductase [Thermoclostridium stercorarium subsp. leptospartum DSM 9219]UZQ86080.1 aldo/keto reductase [Thermoclostridium stercorarium]
MITSIKDCATLNNGVKMPWLGLGVWKITKPEEIDFAVKTALEAGYRSIDTAEVYGNEEGVGKAIRESGIPRDEIFITTKLANSEQRKGYDAALRAFEESRKRLGVEYIDLFLIHWPVKDKYVESWKALIKLYNDGLVRAIGVSNFLIHHLEDIISETGVVPAVNQVELHPWLNQSELVEFCQKHKIQVEAYSPLMGGRLGEVTELNDIANKYRKTPAQIVLRWNLQRGIIVIPKSVHRERIIENSQIFDFSLSDEDMELINSLNRNQRFLPDPNNVYF